MTTSPKPSRLARLSLVFGIAGWAVWCVYFVIFGVMSNGGFNVGSEMDAESLGYLVAFGGPLVASLFTVVFTLIGVAFGIRALLNRDPQRGVAIAGLVFSLMCLLPYFLATILLVASAIQSGGV